MAFEQTPDDPEHRVLPFRARQTVRQPSAKPEGESPVESLNRYEKRPDAEDDYGHRMWMNVLAFGFLVLLVGGGIWMADNIAELRKNQDCVLSGRRTCNNLNAPPAGSLTPSTAKVRPASTPD